MFATSTTAMVGSGMTARVVDLANWREDHPPLVRLAHISGHLMMSSFAFQRAAWRAWLSCFIFRR